MVVRIAAALAVALLLGWLQIGRAQAKLPSYVITGGELGSYAMFFTLPDYAYIDQPGADGPTPMANGPTYDIYGGDVLREYARGVRGPEYRYYPAVHILESVRTEQLRRVSDQRAADLDAVINQALERRGKGELEVGVVAATLGASGVAQAHLWLVPETSTSDVRASGCPCDISASNIEQWIMRDLVETLSNPHALAPPSVLSDLEVRIAFPGDTGYGWFGHYAFPREGAPGRFWIWPSSDRPLGEPYVETTSDFDAVIAEALGYSRRNGTLGGRSGEDSFPVLAGLLATLAAGATLFALRFVRPSAPRPT